MNDFSLLWGFVREAKSQERMGGLISSKTGPTHASWAHMMNTPCTMQ